MVNVKDFSTRKIGGCNVEAMTGVFVHESNYKVQIARRFEEMFEDRVILCRLMCDGGNQILQDIPREREFREYEKVCLLGFGLFDVIQMLFEIGVDIPQFGGDLCEGKVKFHRQNLTIKQFSEFFTKYPLGYRTRKFIAGREGFEPSVDRSPQQFSRLSHSTTLAPSQFFTAGGIIS